MVVAAVVAAREDKKQKVLLLRLRRYLSLLLFVCPRWNARVLAQARS